MEKNRDQKVHRYEVSERKEKNHETFHYAFIKTLIDLFDLQNNLGGQSCKSKLFLEKLVEQIVTYTHLS